MPRDRITDDTTIFSRVLYQLSYLGLADFHRVYDFTTHTAERQGMRNFHANSRALVEDGRGRAGTWPPCSMFFGHHYFVVVSLRGIFW